MARVRSCCRSVSESAKVNKTMPAQSNALTASTFFLAALVSDALTAIDTVQHADVPSSLRGTGIVLVCCLAAPVVINPNNGVYGFFQRPIIGTLLVSAGLAGVHHGGAETRAWDALFTTLCCIAAILLYSTGGVDEQAKKVEGKNQDTAVSTSSSMLAGALLLYASVRTLRSGLRHPSEVRSFHVAPNDAFNATDFETLGYAYASDVATVSVTFGGAVGVGAAVVMIKHANSLSSDTGTITLQLGSAALFQTIAALSTGLTFGEQIDNLQAIYGPSACQSADSVCKVAATSRRFASVNTPLSGLWLSALGLFALAFPPSARIFSQNDADKFSWSRSGLVFGTLAAAIATTLVFLHGSFEGKGGHISYVMLAMIVAVYWSTYLDHWTGSLIYVIAFVWDQIIYVRDWGTDALLKHATSITLICNTILLAMHMLLTTFYYFGERRVLQSLVGIITVAGSSLAVGLYTASACLLMSTDGSYDVSEFHTRSTGSITAASFFSQHFIPVFIWAPLYVCRCEVSLLTRNQRIATWYLSAALVVGIYFMVLAQIEVSPPYGLDAVALLGCAFGAGVLPWAAAATV